MARHKTAVWIHGPPQNRCMGAWIVPRLIFPAFLSRLLRLFPPSEPLAASFPKRVELWSFRSGAPEIHFRGSPPQVVPREYLLFQALLVLRVILARSPLPARAIRCPLLALGQSTAPLPALGQSAAFAPPVRGRGMVPTEWQYLRWCWQGARVAPIGEAPVFSRA